MINLHPALLPKFGGVGMWGHHVHEAVLAAGEKESGCTVHLVDGGCDTGKILVQKKVPVLPDDTPDSLYARIAPEEHKAMVEGLCILSQMLS
jgi:phosphoribosylglycinamide formyltransferase-1